MTNTIDPMELGRALIRCPSVTPDEAGALDLLEDVLGGLGFDCHRLPFSQAGTAEVDNLYARFGDAAPNFCFAGHIDVVPAGDEAAWTVPPFAAEVADGRLWGRGAADMKGAIACFVAAAGSFLARPPAPGFGSISLLLTADEEGQAINGTVKVLEWLKQRGETLDACLVGEPTSKQVLGDTMKVGRRGSVNGHLTVHGTQGHSAYPEHADNPLPRLLAMLDAIAGAPLDEGNEHFPATVPVITSIDVGNPVPNVIPGRAEARFNIRFNDRHTPASIKAWIEGRCASVGGRHDLEIKFTGAPFLCPPGPLLEVFSAAVEKVTGRRPRPDTGGGTSDARFIKDICPVAELGPVGATAHQVDENVSVADLRELVDIYVGVLDGFFAKSS